MKCYKCGKEVHDEVHCPHCGALLKPTYKLLQAVQANDRDAIIQLYRMTAHLISLRMREKGIAQDHVLPLVNQAFKDLLKELPKLDALEQFDALRDGISDNVAYTYLISHDLEVKHCEVKDEVFTITEEMKDELFASLHKRSPKVKKRINYKIIIGVVICLVISVVSGTAFYMSKQKSKAEKKVLGSYTKVENEYYQAVATMSQTPSATEVYKKQYKHTYQAASVVVNHIQRYHLNVDKLKLKAMLRDIDDDGVQELIIGYQKKNEMIITGIYRYNTKSQQTMSMDFIKNLKKYINTTLSNRNQFVVMNGKHKGIAYKYQDHQLKTINTKVKNANDYLKKHGAIPLTLNPKTIIPSHSKESGRVYKVINDKLDTTKEINKYDLDVDGHKDTMEFQYEEDYSEQPYKIIINGKVFSIHEMFINAYVFVLRARNGSTYLLTVFNQDDDVSKWMLYSYQSGELKILLSNTRFHDGSSHKRYCWTFDHVKMIDNQLIITENEVSTFMSYFSFTSAYAVDHDHLKLLSEGRPIQPYQGTNSLNTQYMVLRTSQFFNAYSDVKCTKQGFSVPKGVKVQINAVYIEKEYDVYQIIYDNKIGYVKNNVTKLDPNNHPYFENLVVGS